MHDALWTAISVAVVYFSGYCHALVMPHVFASVRRFLSPRPEKVFCIASPPPAQPAGGPFRTPETPKLTENQFTRMARMMKHAGLSFEEAEQLARRGLGCGCISCQP